MRNINLIALALLAPPLLASCQNSAAPSPPDSQPVQDELEATKQVQCSPQASLRADPIAPPPTPDMAGMTDADIIDSLSRYAAAMTNWGEFGWLAFQNWQEQWPNLSNCLNPSQVSRSG